MERLKKETWRTLEKGRRRHKGIVRRRDREEEK
jgi:hypothetical protein